MIEELQLAFTNQLDELQAGVQSERKALADEDDRELAACRREKIAGLEKLIKRIETMRTEIMQAESEAERAAQDFAEWRRLVVEIRGLMKTRDESSRQIPPLQETVDFALSKLDVARQELGAHQQKQFGALALESEKAEHRKTDARLEREFEKRRSEYGSAVSKLGEVQRRALSLTREIDGLAWKANRLAPANVTRLDPDRASVMSIV